jgi:hypothetical protein
VLGSVILLSIAAGAQIKLGNDVELSGNGTISAGYTGSYGDQIGSSHGLTFGGNAAFTGDYYDPNFLSFQVSPYFNQSRTNSDLQSITNASGVNAGANIFAGSHFPGIVSYTNSYNKTGNYFIPGQPNYVTTGNGQAFSVAWSEELPDAPSVTAGFTTGTSDYSIYGTDQNGSSAFNNFFVNSQYRLYGFNLSGGYALSNGHALIPQPLSAQAPETSSSDNQSYNFAASHLLPMQGNAALAFNHNHLNSDYLGYTFNGSIDTVTATAGFYPKKSWNVAANVSYSDNLAGQIYEAVIPTATTPTAALTSNVSAAADATQTATTTQDTTTSSTSSHSWDFTGTTSYTFPRYLVLSGEASHREQLYSGVNYSSDSFGGGGLFTRPLWGGFLNANLFLSDTRISTNSQNALGLISSVNYARRAGAWEYNFGGSYSQNVQTLLITYTTSNYSFNGNIGRRFGHLIWRAGASFGHSGLTDQPDTMFSSRSYSMGLGYRGYSLQGNYSKSNGNGLATGTGTTPTPLPPVIPADLLILYGGTTYSGTFSGALHYGLTFSATYLKANSNTTSNMVFSTNEFEEEIAQIQYRVRKIGFSGGYTRLVQGFSATGNLPSSTSTFSASIYRWFNFF